MPETDEVIEYRIHDYENNLLTDVFPSWFFFNTCGQSRGVKVEFIGGGSDEHLRNRKLEIFLGHMLAPLPKGIHARFCADTSNLGTGTLTHLFSKRPKVNPTLKRHLSLSPSESAVIEETAITISHTFRE